MKKIAIAAVVSMFVGLLAAGCGNSGGGDGCDYKAGGVHICVTYDSSVDSASVTAACTAESGKLGSCPSASKLGDCAVTSGGLKAVESFYSDGTPALTADQAKSACTSAMGTWTASGG